MSTSLRDVVICVPTKRIPPVRTLESYVPPAGVPVFIIADPEVYRAQKKYYQRHRKQYPMVRVLKGKTGLVPQVICCYNYARIEGYRYFFRLDDDLPPNTFIRKNRSHPSLAQVMRWARKCITKTNTSLAGFCNTSRIDWLGKGYGRSYALIHGGAQICESLNPTKFITTKLKRYEDVYRSCAHRLRDGAVGRVKFVGLNKMPSQQGAIGGSSIKISECNRQKSIKLIVRTFSDFVTYLGEKSVKGGAITYPHFRYKRHKEYVR